MMDRVILPCEVTLTEALVAPAHLALEGLKNSALLPLRALTQHEQLVRVFRIAMHLTEYTEELASVQRRHQTSVESFIQKLETLLTRAQQAGLVSAESPAHSIAIGLYALIDGLMRRWTLAPGSFDLVQTGEQNLNALLAGLRPR
jgi:TetR/AcrR family acrAB operon transcriptional repressor